MKRFLFILLTFVSLTMSAQTISVKEKAAIKRQYINFCKELNQQLPAQVDEMTTLNSIVFMNWTITATYSVVLDASEVPDEDMALLKEATHEASKEMARKMFACGSYQITRNQFRTLMKVVGLQFRAIYKDVYDNFMFSVLLNYKDF